MMPTNFHYALGGLQRTPTLITSSTAVDEPINTTVAQPYSADKLDLGFKPSLSFDRIGNQSMLLGLFLNATRALGVASIPDNEFRPQRNLGHHKSLISEFLKLSFRVGSKADKFKFRILSNRRERGHETRVD